LPFAFSFCFRNGDVGGERGFDAAAAFLAGESESEGCNMKTKITIHNTTPTTIVSGFVRRSDRTGPMPSYVGCPQTMRLGGSKIACVESEPHTVLAAIPSGVENSIVSPARGFDDCAVRE
jgi:hypothetical protein